jgi:hypothetical protein
LTKGKCPHCSHDVVFIDGEVYRGQGNYGRVSDEYIGNGPIEQVRIRFLECPNCGQLTVSGKVINKRTSDEKVRYVWPYSAVRFVPPEVPQELKTDYVEASEVLQISPKASAALSRRCLQIVLTQVSGAKSKDLADQIAEVIPKLPPHLGEIVDSIRAVGNFAAHPIKSTSTGQIVDVEPGEAELNLDVLDGLFDFYYVQPARNKARKAAIDKKLKDAGKPPLR